MASFTDSIPQFTPYVQQLPVEAMVAVGMEKQKRYDEGVQKIQQSIDKIAGLEVVKDSEKAYLQSKLNQLGNDLTFVAAGDFSNYQLVNSVDGMAKQIAYDPNIQTAVSSAARRRKEIEYMEEARKKGELTPQNELYFKTRDAEWINNPELGQAYNAKYVPYVDRFKLAKEKFDAIKPDNLTFDEVYQKGPDGKYVTDKKGNLVLSEAMTRVKEEGYLPAKLQATIDEIFSDPRFNQQLTIDAEYNYRGVSKEDLAISVTKEANKIKNTYEDKLDELNIQLQLDPDNDDLKQQIKNTELAISKLGENLQETGKLISENPNAVKTSLYKSLQKDNYTAMFNVSKKSTELLENPLWQAKFQLQKLANEYSRWAQEFAWKKQSEAANYEQRERFKKQDIELAKLKVLKGKSGTGEDGELSLQGDNLRQTAESQDYETVAMHEEELAASAQRYNNSKINLIWSSLFDVQGKQGDINRQKLREEQKKGFNLEQSKQNIINRVAKSRGYSNPEDYVLELKNITLSKYNTGNSKKKLKDTNYVVYQALQDYESSELQFKVQEDFDKNIKGSNLAEFYKQMEKVPFQEKNLKIGNKSYTLTKQDAIDLALIAKYEDKSWASKDLPWKTEEAKALSDLANIARSRLTRNGKSQLINNFLDNALLDKTTRKKLKNSKTIPSELEDRSAIGEWMFGVRDSRNRQRTYFNNRAFDGIYDIFDTIDPSKIKTQIKNTAEAIRQFKTVAPNLIGEVAIGDDNVDKTIMTSLGGIVAEYSRNVKPIGVNVDDFFDDVKGNTNDLKNFRGLNLQRGVEKDATGKLIPYLQSENGKIYLNKEEANKFGINPDRIYENEYTMMIESTISVNGGTSCNGFIKDVNTYRYNDVAMNNSNFPQLNGTDYTAKVNFQKNGDTFIPYIYINNGVEERVRELPVKSDNLGKLIMQDIPSFISPATLQQLLSTK